MRNQEPEQEFRLKKLTGLSMKNFDYFNRYF